MPVPTTGNFDMFGTATDTTIAGAIVEGGGDVTGLTTFTQLIGVSTAEYFDSTYAGTITTPSTDVSASLQYRNYPLNILNCDLTGGTIIEDALDCGLSGGTADVVVVCAAPTISTVTHTGAGTYEVTFTLNGADAASTVIEASADQITWTSYAKGITSPQSVTDGNGTSTRYFRMKTICNDGGISADSNIVTVTIITCVSPTISSVTNNGAGQYSVLFTLNGATATQVEIEVSTDQITWTSNTVDATTPQVIYSGDGTGTRYFRMRTNCSNGGVSSYSNTVTVTGVAAAYSCGDGDVTQTTTSLAQGVYPNTLVDYTDIANGIFNWNTDGFNRPNKFTLYANGVETYSTNWVGEADYPGPWGATLNKTPVGTYNFTWGSTINRYVRVDYGASDPTPPSYSDSATFSILCGVPSPTTNQFTNSSTNYCFILLDRNYGGGDWTNGNLTLQSTGAQLFEFSKVASSTWSKSLVITPAESDTTIRVRLTSKASANIIPSFKVTSANSTPLNVQMYRSIDNPVTDHARIDDTTTPDTYYINVCSGQDSSVVSMGVEDTIGAGNCDGVGAVYGRTFKMPTTRWYMEIKDAT
tara:strand:+ start:1048 stop:2802 length:1755 start_codon:yes stop_codon:yes gene_type:complete